MDDQKSVQLATPLLIRVNDDPNPNARAILYANRMDIQVLLLTSTWAAKDWIESNIGKDITFPVR
jgi:hypothetical protein